MPRDLHPLSEIKGKNPDDWLRERKKLLTHDPDYGPKRACEGDQRPRRRMEGATGELAGATQGQCWYCDQTIAVQIGQSTIIAPRTRLLSCDVHGGYWWLAFSLGQLSLLLYVLQQPSSRQGVWN